MQVRGGNERMVDSCTKASKLSNILQRPMWRTFSCLSSEQSADTISVSIYINRSAWLDRQLHVEVISI